MFDTPAVTVMFAFLFMIAGIGGGALITMLMDVVRDVLVNRKYIELHKQHLDLIEQMYGYDPSGIEDVIQSLDNIGLDWNQETDD